MFGTNKQIEELFNIASRHVDLICDRVSTKEHIKARAETKLRLDELSERIDKLFTYAVQADERLEFIESRLEQCADHEEDWNAFLDVFLPEEEEPKKKLAKRKPKTKAKK